MKAILKAIQTAIKCIISFVVNIVKTITTFVVSGIVTVTTKIVQAVDKSIPGGMILATVLLVNTLGLLFGAGLLFSGIAAGVGLSLSLAMLWLGMPKEIKIGNKIIPLKKLILKSALYSTWILDVLITVLLTLLGFSVGPTMGIIATFLGLNISAMFSLLRWIAQKDNNKATAPLAVA